MYTYIFSNKRAVHQALHIWCTTKSALHQYKYVHKYVDTHMYIYI